MTHVLFRGAKVKHHKFPQNGRIRYRASQLPDTLRGIWTSYDGPCS